MTYLLLFNQYSTFKIKMNVLDYCAFAFGKPWPMSFIPVGTTQLGEILLNEKSLQTVIDSPFIFDNLIYKFKYHFLLSNVKYRKILLKYI